MEVIQYEQSSSRLCPDPVIFLAGPTVRGNQQHLVSWRFEAIEEFRKQGFKGTLIVPEFTDKTESDKGRDDLPLWEFRGMDRAKCVMFWIARTRELIGLCTNFEFGYWIAIDPFKVVYGRPEDSYRTHYNDIMWRRVRGQYAKIHDTLESTVRGAIERASKT